MPLHGAVEAARAFSMVSDLAPTGCTGAWSSSSCHQGEEEGEEDDGRHITMVISAMPDGTCLHRSTGPTPRTAGTTDRHHAANLIDPAPCHVSTATSTSFKRSRSFGL
jgi:hypothetical protein